MIKDMNKTIAATPKQDADIEYVFGLMWPKLEERINQIRAMPAEGTTPNREPSDVMADILANVREIGRQGSTDSWRVNKTLALVARLYQETLGKPAPSMAQLAAMQLAERDGVTITIPAGGLAASGLAPYLAASSGVTETPLVARESATAGEAPPCEERAGGMT